MESTRLLGEHWIRARPATTIVRPEPRVGVRRQHAGVGIVEAVVVCAGDGPRFEQVRRFLVRKAGVHVVSRARQLVHFCGYERRGVPAEPLAADVDGVVVKRTVGVLDPWRSGSTVSGTRC